jgi:hypothetical protein
MLYKLDFTPPSPLESLPVTGAMLHPAEMVRFVPWQPSAWPAAPADDHEFVLIVKRIFELSMLLEISNVMDDATARTGGLEHRGHVIAISLFCALDAISSYGYGKKNGRQIPPFVRAHFPPSYRPHAEALLQAYRHALIHSWNLFIVALTPEQEVITARGGILSFGLRNFFDALKQSTESFLEQLHYQPALLAKARTRYEELRRTAIRSG